MKRNCLFMLLLLGIAFNASAQKITLKGKGLSLYTVFAAVKEQTGYNVVYNTSQIDKAKPVTVEVVNEPLEKFLQEVLGERFRFTIRGKTISVFESNKSEGKENGSEMLEGYVKGRVVDEKGEPLAGATVRLKGANKVSSTDANGDFALKNVNVGDVLVITYVGLEEKLFTLKENNSILNVVLKASLSALDEVIVSTGYWETSQRFNTGNISKVTAETIEKQPVTNVLQALQGNISGVIIQANNGLPGSGFFVQIRGQNSLRSAGNTPLYIVDGVPYPSASPHTTIVTSPNGSVHPLNSINPTDIESIEILKDADATAIYGSRGANGVVVIRTKRAKKGGSSIDLSIQSGIGRVGRLPKLLNTAQWVEMRKEAFVNDGVAMTQNNAPDLLLWDTTRYTNWQKEFIGNFANQTQASLSFQGGNQVTSFLFRSSYHSETTVFPGDFKYQRGSTHFNVNHRFPSENFKIDFGLTYTLDNNNLPRNDLTAQSIRLAPNSPAIFDKNGNLNWENSTWSNPYASLYNEYTGNTHNFIANATLAYIPISGLTVKIIGGYNNLRMDENVINPIRSFDPASANTGQTYIADKRATSWIIEPQIVYERNFGGFYTNAMVGGALQESLSDGKAFRGWGYTSDMLIRDLMAAPNIRASSTENHQYRYLSTYGRLNIRLKDRYIVNLTARRDGSTRFGSGRKYADFFSVGTAWIFSESVFFRNSFPGVSFGKLRMSYGSTGSDQIGDYQYFDTYSSYDYPYNGETGIYPLRLANPEFSWEVNRKFEAAIETGFWRDRLLFNLNWYRNRSSNQLVGYPLPSITGFESIQYNMPATVQNTGWEIEVTAEVFKRGNFLWSVSANATIPKNKLIDFPGIEKTSYANTRMIGKSLDAVNRIHYIGVDPNRGVFMYEDINNDGLINTEDRLFKKSIGQIWYGGLQNRLSYKGWSIEFHLQLVKQTGNNYLAFISQFAGSRFTNQLTVVMDRWRQPGDKTDVQRFTQAAGSDAARAYSLFQNTADNRIGDRSFVRLNNLTVTKPFDNLFGSFLKGKVYLQGQNLMTITKLPFDPESGSIDMLPGLQRIVLGFQLTL